MSTAGNFPDTTSSGGTVIMVARQFETGAITTLDAGGVFLGAGSSVNMQIQRQGGTSVEGGFNTVSLAESGLSDVSENTFVIIRLTFDTFGNTIVINGGTPATTLEDGTGYIATPLQFFKTLSAPFGNKQIAECLIWTRELTTLEITDVENYLTTKYAL